MWWGAGSPLVFLSFLSQTLLNFSAYLLVLRNKMTGVFPPLSQHNLTGINIKIPNNRLPE